LGRQEPLEEHVAPRRIDRGDAEAEADRAVGGAPPALAEDVAPARHVDDRADREKVRRDLELRDERELLVDLRPDLLRDALAVALPRPLPGESEERLVGGLALCALKVAVHEIGELVRESVRELLDREA